MRHIFFCVTLLAFASLLIACGQPAASNQIASNDDSPTGAYKRLYDAVKSKNSEAIKAAMTKKTLDFAKMASAQQNKPVEQVLENGFTATTFSPTLPEIRDQRIDGDMGAVEVYNSRDKAWEDLPFIREDGVWKLAVGELFAGTYQSPGKSQSQKEREAANGAGNNLIPTNANVMNVNTNGIKPIVPKPATNANMK
jgi:hypothetical protein